MTSNTRVCLVLALALVASRGLVPAVSAEPGGGTVQFASPRRFATAVGASTATLDVVPPAGATIVSVTMFVDGAPRGTTSSPPWMFSWTAGDGTVEHKLEAVAKFSDGTEARASVATSRLVVNEREEVALVNLYAIARGAKGTYVNDLAQREFQVYENGRLQSIDRFSSERRPLRIAIVLDTSLSMEGDKLKSAIASAIAFLDVLRPGDEGLVVGFSDEVRILQDLTSDRSKLERAIRSVSATGGTSLYDAIYAASERLAAFDGRRVLLLLSDGRDEAANGLEPGSLHTFEEARDRALRNEVMVFAIGLGKYLAHDAKALGEDPGARATELDFYGRQPVATILSSLSLTTGGSAVFAPGAGQLRRSFEQVADDLRHQYLLAYPSDDTKHDGKWREIKVVVDRAGVSVTSRKGYFAPADVPGARSTSPS
jgi:Ca-activated chloride channel family protein